MYSFIGILIVAFGFLAPHLSKGMLSSTLFFWIGFLLFLSPIKKKSSFGDWMRWAKVGLVANIVGGIISIIYSQFLLNTSLAKNYLLGKAFYIFIWLTTPISQIVALIFQRPRYDLSANSEIIVQLQTGFPEASITSMLDIIFFMLIAIILGKYFTKKHRYLY